MKGARGAACAPAFTAMAIKRSAHACSQQHEVQAPVKAEMMKAKLLQSCPADRTHKVHNAHTPPSLHLTSIANLTTAHHMHHMHPSLPHCMSCIRCTCPVPPCRGQAPQPTAHSDAQARCAGSAGSHISHIGMSHTHLYIICKLYGDAGTCVHA